MSVTWHRSLVAVAIIVIGSLSHVPVARGGANLIPEHQHRLGSCPNGSQCNWDCGGAQCDNGFGQNICVDGNDCPNCLPGPICDNGVSRQPCALPTAIPGFTARLIVRADETDALCAPVGTGCNQNGFADDCGSRVTMGLRGRKQDATEFAISKDLNLCNVGDMGCAEDPTDRDCLQCLPEGFTPPQSTCPLTDPVFLCNGQGGTGISESDLDGEFSNFRQWLVDMQPLEFMQGDLPPDLQVGVPVIASAEYVSSSHVCSDINPPANPPTSCSDDSGCPSNETCYAEAEFCITVAIVKGRCLGGANNGTLCALDSECPSASCGIAGVPNLSPIVSPDTDLPVANMGSCAGPPGVTPTPTRTPTPTSTATPIPGNLDHFTCYKSGGSKGFTKFGGVQIPPGATLVDQFGSSLVEVKKSKLLCAPTNKNGEDPTAPAHPEHLKAYQIKNPLKPAPLFPANLVVVDQFNPTGLALAAKKQQYLLVPAAKSLTGPTPLPTPGAFVTDHFECYKVAAAKAAPKFVPVPALPLGDQFGNVTVDVKKPKVLCNPVNKNGEDPTAPTHVAHLMCYQVKQVDPVPFAKLSGVFVQDQLGPEVLDVKKPALLCVPALKTP